MLNSKNLAFLFILTITSLFCFPSGISASTIQIPQWYELSARLKNAPEKDVPNEVIIELKALVGTLKNSRIRLIMPESWQIKEETRSVPSIMTGQSSQIIFPFTPASFLSQGSIIVEADLEVPVNELINRVRSDFVNEADEMSKVIRSWPARSKRYADISFAIYPEESFYPLTGDMWLNYADKISPTENFRGPGFLDFPVISTHQAQTDVEMFEKLEKYLKSDPLMAEKLQKSGIEIEKKRIDQIVALYTLAARAFQNEEYDNAINLVSSCESAVTSLNSSILENIQIAAMNLRGLSFWAKGNRRLAEDSMKKAFYANRKHPAQRYVLRNIGLLMLQNNDKTTAAEMYRLAAGFKNSYTLLKKESELIRKQ